MTELENPSKRPFVWPADYYSSPSPNRILPRWAPLGCGAASLVLLIIIFAAGAFLSGGGFADFMDFAIGMSVSELKAQYGADVSAPQKETLEAEIARMRENLREERISITALQPFLDLLRNASSDKKITAEEASNLEAAVRLINKRAKPAPVKPPGVHP
jgi:hypothetical protein